MYIHVRTYKRIKKITENAARLNRNGLNLQDRQKVIYLLGSKRKNAIISEYMQKSHLSSQNRVRIKNFSSRRFSVYFNLLFDTCFWCVCNLFTCECILLSAFNRCFIRFYIRPQQVFYPAPEGFLYAFKRNFLRCV